jgi:hypothetical protein
VERILTEYYGVYLAGTGGLRSPLRPRSAYNLNAHSTHHFTRLPANFLSIATLQIVPSTSPNIMLEARLAQAAGTAYLAMVLTRDSAQEITRRD